MQQYFYDLLKYAKWNLFSNAGKQIKDKNAKTQNYEFQHICSELWKNMACIDKDS